MQVDQLGEGMDDEAIQQLLLVDQDLVRAFYLKSQSIEVIPETILKIFVNINVIIHSS